MDRESVFDATSKPAEDRRSPSSSLDVPQEAVVIGKEYVCTRCGREQGGVRYLSLFEISPACPIVRVSTDLRLGWDSPDPRSVVPRSPGYVHNVDLTIRLSSSRPVLYPDLSRFRPDGQQEDDDSELDLSLKL